MDSVRSSSEDFGPEIYWQIWSLADGTSTRSNNFRGDLPQFKTDPGGTEVRTVVLDNGVRAMVVNSRFGLAHGGGSPGGPG